MISPLRAAHRPVDEDRMLRCLLAWQGGDKLALDAVLAETNRDPAGAPGLLFRLISFTSDLATEYLEGDTDQVADQLRARLLENQAGGAR